MEGRACASKAHDSAGPEGDEGEGAGASLSSSPESLATGTGADARDTTIGQEGANMPGGTTDTPSGAPPTASGSSPTSGNHQLAGESPSRERDPWLTHWPEDARNWGSGLPLPIRLSPSTWGPQGKGYAP